MLKFISRSTQDWLNQWKWKVISHVQAQSHAFQQIQIANSGTKSCYWERDWFGSKMIFFYFLTNAPAFGRKQFFSLPFVARAINIKLHNSNRICCAFQQQPKIGTQIAFGSFCASLHLISWFFGSVKWWSFIDTRKLVLNWKQIQTLLETWKLNTMPGFWKQTKRQCFANCLILLLPFRNVRVLACKISLHPFLQTSA